MISPELVSVLVSIPVLVGIRQRWIARKARQQMARRLEQVCRMPEQKKFVVMERKAA